MSSTCPIDRQDIQELRNPSRPFVNLINGLEIWCPFKGVGCSITVKLGDCADHEAKCEYNPEHRKECAVGGCGAMLTQDEAKEHNCIDHLKQKLLAREAELQKLKADEENDHRPLHFGESQRIAAKLEEVMELDIAEPFLHPVEHGEYPDYALVISYPVDLNAIKAKLDAGQYANLLLLKLDIKHIALNAARFNQPRTNIVKLARIITKLCLQICSQEELPSDVKGLAQTLRNNFKWEETI